MSVRAAGAQLSSCTRGEPTMSFGNPVRFLTLPTVSVGHGCQPVTSLNPFTLSFSYKQPDPTNIACPASLPLPAG